MQYWEQNLAMKWNKMRCKIIELSWLDGDLELRTWPDDGCSSYTEWLMYCRRSTEWFGAEIGGGILLRFCSKQRDMPTCIIYRTRRREGCGKFGDEMLWRSPWEPSGFCTYHIIRSAHTLYLCVLCGSENKQWLFPYTALTGWFL